MTNLDSLEGDLRPGRTPSWRALYPFTSRTIVISGCRYHYVDEFTGAEPLGTLLFVHGNPTWSFHWRELILAWRSRFRCIAVDHLGCGLSQRSEKPLQLSDHIDNLVSFVNHLDLQNVTLVAQDWGGAIGLATAVRTPHRWVRIVLFNTGAFRPWFIPWRIRICRWPLLGRLGVQGANLFVRAALRMTLSRKGTLQPAVRSGYLAPYGSWADRRAVHDFVLDIPTSDHHPTWQTLHEIEDSLPALGNLPVLLVWGMKDWCFTPACLDKFRMIWPQAEAHPLADVGHWVVEDAPQEAREIVEEFLIATGSQELQTPSNPPPIAIEPIEDATSRANEAAAPCRHAAGILPADLPPTVRTRVLLACLLEATAAKPGNVHPAASFDDLTYGDLRKSAIVVSGVLQHATVLSVGATVLSAVRAMRSAVGTNAHLGTILLLSPLASVPSDRDLRSGVGEVLSQLDQSHTEYVYEAIRLAHPAGLGKVSRGDVHSRPPTVSLCEAMSWAAENDLVARQYVSGFQTVFDEVAEPLNTYLARDVPLLEAVVDVHVRLLATHGDSLIARKCGQSVSERVREQADAVIQSGTMNSPAYRDRLAEFDRWLRSDGHRMNPGTTADLIAAGLYVLLAEGSLPIAVAAETVRTGN